jgi:hypothetical protein
MVSSQEGKLSRQADGLVELKTICNKGEFISFNGTKHE